MRRDHGKALYKRQWDSLEKAHEETEIQRKALRRGKNILEDILPKSLKFKSPINSVAGKKLAKTFGLRYLKLRINESHFWINFSYNEIESFFIHNSENSINDKENCFYSEIYDNLS